LAVLADAVTDAGDADRIRVVVDHIVDQRTMVQPLLAGPASATITAELAKLIELRLSTRDVTRFPELVVPVEIASRQLAEAQMALIRGCLDDTSRCSSHAVSMAIYRSSRALVAALEYPLGTCD
jgi:hypothetical protein